MSGRGMVGSNSGGNISSTRLSSAQSELKTLETTRQRLLQLTWTLSALKRDMELSDPLPSWPNIQTSFALLAHHLSRLSSLLATTDDEDDDDANVLHIGHAHPLPSFPASQEGLLGQLLRKKLELGVEKWVVSGQETAKRSISAENPVYTESERDRGGQGSEDGNSHEADEEVWNWAARRVRELGRRVPWNTDYTLAEREMGIEKVKTGLKRKLDSSGPAGDDAAAGDSEGDDDEEEEEDSDEEDAGATAIKNNTTLPAGQAQSGTSAVAAGPKMLSLEDVYRYMSTGSAIVPPGR